MVNGIRSLKRPKRETVLGLLLLIVCSSHNAATATIHQELPPHGASFIIQRSGHYLKDDFCKNYGFREKTSALLPSIHYN
jgi:hypothetical protein